MPVVQCPRCRSELDVDQADLGHTVECPQCQAVFPAIAEPRGRRDEPPSRPRDDGSEPPPWRRNRDGDRPSQRPERDDDRYDSRRRDYEGGYDDRDDYDWERSPSDPRRDEDRARKIVGAPARALMIASIIMAVIAGLIAAGLLIAGAYFVNQPAVRGGGGNPADQAIGLFMYGAWALFGTVYSGFIGFAAAKARDPSKNAWGYAASITGFASIVLCSFINPYTWCAIGFGIWLLIAMNKPEVQRFVRWSKRPPSRHRGSPLEDDDAAR